MLSVASDDVLFEVNVGAILRGYRKTPYPYENLLHIIKKSGGKIILSLDCHNKDFLSYDLSDTKNYLKNVGFNCVYTIKNGKFIKESL